MTSQVNCEKFSALLVSSLAMAAAFFIAPSATAAESGFQFNRDIRPILSENCFQCHGPDIGGRKGGFRLDTKEGLFGTNKKGRSIVSPGNIEASELWKRISSSDPEYQMPPKESRKELSSVQKSMLGKWIAAGAGWQSHWSFIVPERPTVPSVKSAAWIRNPIDSFILAKLDEKGLVPASEADRRVLARRVSLDLTGLPPSPAEVDSFVRDRSQKAYENYIEQLFRSPHYGEHRARYWLDAARYADTHGLHFDNYREMWPYRDWVVKAYNSNMRFDRFTVLQLAGDLLPDPGQDELIATGFHRCNVTTNEGGTIEEENLANYARDRVETTSAVWLGLTANCASCHDHKFDPITMKDFYSMAAFFRNTTQGGYDGNVKNSNPSIPLISDPLKWKRWQALQGELTGARKAVDEQRKKIDKGFESWLSGASVSNILKGLEVGLVSRIPLNTGSTNELSGTLKGRKIVGIARGPLETKKEGKIGPALVLANGGTIEFPKFGDVSKNQAFTIAAWVYIPGSFNDEACLMSRMEPGESRKGWDFWHEQGQLSVHLVHSWPGDAIKLRTPNRVARRGGWQHLMLTSDGSGRPEGFRFYFDGSPQEMEIHKANRLTGEIRTSSPFRIGRRPGGEGLNGIAVQDLRLYGRELLPAEASALSRQGFKELFARPSKDWKDDDKRPLQDYYFALHHPEARPALDRLRSLEYERRSVTLNNPVTHIQQEKKDSEPMAHVLFRGQYDKPKEKLGAATFAVLHSLPEGAPRNRLGLAKWLVSPENPLMARVTMNRVWQEIFGTGLVRTADDFGVMGEAPVNQALLDWLAVEFRDSGWDLQHMYRLILRSSAYRQSATTTPEKLEKDPGNRLLSRGPRFRMDAEMIRDYALSAGGLLVRKIGGESVRPYQPVGVWEAVAMPESNTHFYRKDFGEDLYRRSLYTFWKRAAPPANMDILNAPSRENCTVRRERTNTPLQALVTLNDPQFIEAARNLADLACRKTGGRSQKAISFLAERILLRPLTTEEYSLVDETYAGLLKHYSAHPDAAAELIKVGDSTPQSIKHSQQLAALTMVANQLLNLDEALNK